MTGPYCLVGIWVSSWVQYEAFEGGDGDMNIFTCCEDYSDCCVESGCCHKSKKKQGDQFKGQGSNPGERWEATSGA